MNIKAILFFIIIVLGFIMGSGDDPNGQKRKWYVIIIISLLILESCLRSVSVGLDTDDYYYSFSNIKYQSWQDIFSSFRAAYVEGIGKDPGYSVFMKLAQIVSPNFNVFLFLCALVFFVPLGMILYRYSTHMLQLVFAFTLYVALFNIVALSGIRQQIATGFSFMAFLQLGKNHHWEAILLIALGALIHISVLIFMLVPIIRLLRPKQVKTFHLISLISFPAVIAFAGPIMLLLASFLANDYYSGYGKSQSSNFGAFSYIIMMELLSLFCYIAIKKETIYNNHKIALLYSMLPLITITAPLISLNGAMIRVGQYFTLYMMLLTPMSIDAISKLANRRIIYFSFIAILLFLSFKSGTFHYYFFWQQPQI